MENQVIQAQVQQVEVIDKFDRAQCDLQVETAKRFPRDEEEAKAKIIKALTRKAETAGKCFYSVPRGGKQISGLSVKFAKVVLSYWGNIRIQAFVKREPIPNPKQVTAVAIAWDLERNTGASIEWTEKTVYQNGQPYNDDMRINASNIAVSKAYRNVVLNLIPEGIIEDVVEEVQNVAKKIDGALDLDTRRKNLIEAFQRLGISRNELFEYAEVKREGEIDNDIIFNLRGTYNALKDGAMNINEFRSFIAERRNKEAAEKKQADNADKIAQAMAETASNSTGQPNTKPETKKAAGAAKTAKKGEEVVDTETGEIFNI